MLKLSTSFLSLENESAKVEDAKSVIRRPFFTGTMHQSSTFQLLLILFPPPAAYRSPPGLVRMSELNKPLELLAPHVAPWSVLCSTCSFKFTQTAWQLFSITLWAGHGTASRLSLSWEHDSSILNHAIFHSGHETQLQTLISLFILIVMWKYVFKYTYTHR